MADTTSLTLLSDIQIKQLRKLVLLKDHNIDYKALLHSIIDDLCSRNLGYNQYGNLNDILPIIISYKTFINKSIGMNLSNKQVYYFDNILIYSNRY